MPLYSFLLPTKPDDEDETDVPPVTDDTDPEPALPAKPDNKPVATRPPAPSATARFNARVNVAQERGASRAEAIASIARHDPSLHRAYLAEANSRRAAKITAERRRRALRRPNPNARSSR